MQSDQLHQLLIDNQELEVPEGVDFLFRYPEVLQELFESLTGSPVTCGV